MKTERLYSGLPDFVDRFPVMFSFVLHFLLHALNVETFFWNEAKLSCSAESIGFLKLLQAQ